MSDGNIVVGIAGFAVCAILWVVSFGLLKANRLARLSRIVEGADKGQEELIDRLKEEFAKQSEDLGAAWKSYSEGFVRSGSGGLYRDLDAAEFFNATDALEAPLGLEFFRHLPGILTGLGIIFTFNGIRKGLAEAARSLGAGAPSSSSTPMATKTPAASAALESTSANLQGMTSKLLNAVAPAFLLSLTAVTSAIIFLVVERLIFSRVLHELHRLQRALDSRFPRLTPSRLMREISEHTRNTVRWSEEAAGSLKSFNTDLSVSLQNAMSSAMSPLMEQQTIKLAQSNEVLSGSVKEMGGHLAQALKSIQDQATQASGQAVQGLVEQFQEALTKNASSQIQEMLRSIEGVSGLLEGQKLAQQKFLEQMNSIVASQDQRAREQQQSLLQQVGQFTGEITREVTDHHARVAAKSNETLGEISKQVGEHLLRTQQQQNEVLSEMRRHFDDSLRRLSEQITEGTDKTSVGINGMLESVERLARHVNDSTLQVMEQGTQATVKQIEQLSENMLASSRTYTSELTESLKQFRRDFDTSLSSLKQQVAAAAQSSQVSSQSVVEAAQALSLHVETTTRALATQLQSGAASTLSTVGKDLTQLTQDQIGTMQSTVQGTLGDLRSATEQMLNENRQANRALLTGLGELVTKLSGMGDDSQASAERFAQVVRLASDNLEKLLGGFDTPLTRLKTVSDQYLQTLEKLDALSTGLRAASTAMQQGASELNLSVKNFDVSRQHTERALTLSAEQAKAMEAYRQQLSEALSQIRQQTQELQQQVSGLRIETSSTFQQMKADAQEYTSAFGEGARKFLREVDEQLTKGISSLGGGIEELAEVLGDMRDVTEALVSRK